MRKLYIFVTLALFTISVKAQICTVVITHVINGHQVQYYVTSPDSPTNYSWFFGSGASPSLSSIQNPIVNYANPGTFICSCSVYGGPNSCSATFSHDQDTVTIISTGISEQSSIVTNYSLSNSSLIIESKQKQKVEINLLAINGGLITKIFEGYLFEGSNNFDLESTTLPNGIYLLQVNKEDGQFNKKIYWNKK